MSDQARMGSTVLSRRAAVRGAVWALPAVTVATTAPAFANTSGQLTVTELMASYAPDQPEQVLLSATVSGFDASYQLTVTITGGDFDSVESAGAGSASSAAASHTLVFTGTAADFHATLDLGSRTELPWRGFQGPAFTVSATASSDGRQSESTTAAVAAYPMPSAQLNGDASPTASLSRLASDSMAAHREYPGVIGQMALVVAIPRMAGVPKPDTTAVHNGWTRTLVDDESNAWLYRFVTNQSHHTSRTGLTQNADRGPAPDGGGYYEFWADMSGMPAALVGEEAFFYYSVDGDTAARFAERRRIIA